MAIKDILVHVDDQEKSEVILKTAIALARELGAHLTALYVKQPVEIPLYADVTIPQTVFDEAEKYEQEKLQTAKSAFDHVVHGQQLLVEWRHAEGRTVEQLIAHSACYDLLLVNQSASTHIDVDENIADRIVLESGRPVLVIPGSMQEYGDFARVVVAWNSRKEATRAIHDAMPLLERAQQVSVVSVKTSPDDDVPCADIAKHLARHGVNVEVEQTDEDIVDVGHWLLSYLDEYNANLVVMGAYGHSRYRELIFGGVTRQMLRDMPVPCLMSH